MASLFHLLHMWLAGWLAAVAVTIRRLLLGPTMPSWTWRTDWTVAFARAVIAVASRYRDDAFLSRFGLTITAPVPMRLRSRIDVRRVTAGAIVADRYLPTTQLRPTVTMLYFHGGGYVFGNPGTHRQFVARLVEATQTGAIAPRYRLAPVHRYPAAVDDALEAYGALLEAGIAPDTIVVAGDSAGGGLAMALLVRLRSQGMPLPAGALLFSPYVDLTHRSGSIRSNARTDYLPLAALDHPNDWYALPAELTEPEVSPVYADLTGLPPMLVFAGGAEMLLDDSRRLAEHAARDGVAVDLVVEDQMMHVWPAIVEWEPATARTLATATRWIASIT